MNSSPPVYVGNLRAPRFADGAHLIRLLTDEHLRAGYAFSGAGPFDGRKIPGQYAGGHQVADLGAELSLGHPDRPRFEPASSRSITTPSRFLLARMAQALSCSAKWRRSSSESTSRT